MEAYALNYYELLDIEPHASLVEIKAAYARQLALFRELLGRKEQPAADRLAALREAFKTLGDPAARRAYDEKMGHLPVAGAPPAAIPPVIAERMVAEPAAWRDEPFEFVGDGGEYFRIWIVNVFLSILTLGFYSPWAKVRREQYFHRNLMLDGSGFDYHGRPMAILKGRLIALALLLGLSATKHIGMVAYGVALLCLMPLIPWLVVKAFRFRAFNTSYRGLRFSFHGTYWQAFKVFVGYGLLVPLTLWLAFPVFYRQLRKFILDNLRFGTTDFECSVTTGTLYKIFLLPGLLFLVMMVGIVAVIAAVVSAAGANGGLAALGAVFVVIPLAVIVIQAVVVPYVAARTTNAVWQTTRLGEHRFSCDIPVGGYIRLTVVNWLAILFTLGLFSPWARVRVARFRAEHLALEVRGSLDEFVAGEASAVSALGDETAEMFDLDIGL